MQSSLRLLSTSISPQLVSVPFISPILSLNGRSSTSYKTLLSLRNGNQAFVSPHTSQSRATLSNAPQSRASLSNGSWSSSYLSSKAKQYISTSACRQSHVDVKVSDFNINCIVSFLRLCLLFYSMLLMRSFVHSKWIYLSEFNNV